VNGGFFGGAAHGGASQFGPVFNSSVGLRQIGKETYMALHSLKRSRRHGFTLVELLVVIGIIALLIAMLLPVLKKAKEAANSVKCMANAKQLMTAAMMYTYEMKGALPVPPSINDFYNPATKGFGGSLIYYMSNSAPAGAGVLRFDAGALLPYVSKGSTNPPTAAETPGSRVLKELLNCPSDDVDAFRPVYWGPMQIPASIKRNFTYSWNSHIRNDQAPPNYSAPIHMPGDPIPDVVTKMSQVKSPSHKILLIEELAPNDGAAWIMLNDADDEPGFRHNGRGNYGFADGHVDSMLPTTLGFKAVRGYQHTSMLQPATVGSMRQRYYFKLNREQ
jgi:prepilin-type N-terminal cleavage/methylation domain-containing protein/prepilin-type processing-associated H-X9-DG protein